MSFLLFPNPILLVIYNFLEDDVGELAFRLTCKKLDQVVSHSNGSKEKRKIHIQPKKACQNLRPTTSIDYFNWFRSVCPSLRLHHITTSDNLLLIQYAVERLGWTLKSKGRHRTSSLACLQYLHLLPNFRFTEDMTWYIVFKGSVECLQYARNNELTLNAYFCSLVASRTGHLEVLKLFQEEILDLIKREPSTSKEITKTAAEYGRMEILQYLREQGCPWNEKACLAAASGGHFEVLKYLHQNGCPWDEGTCSSAAKMGHLQILQYAHENGCPWNEDTCSNAALRGQLETLKYAHENGCPWDKSSSDVAASGGYLKVLKYLHQNGCPWDEWACRTASSNGHFEVVAYLHENGVPCSRNSCKYRKQKQTQHSTELLERESKKRKME